MSPMIGTLEWGLEELAAKLRFSVDDADEAYDGGTNDPWKILKRYLNQAQRLIVTDARANVNPDSFIVVKTITWPASQVRFDISEVVHDRTNIHNMQNVTDGEPGYPMNVQTDVSLSGSAIWWYDRRTMQWGDVGPSRASTIRIRALAHPNLMENEADTPNLIPYDHLDLWIQEAAIIGREDADDEAPSQWIRRRDRLRMNLHTEIQQGGPQSPGKAQIAVTDGYYTVI